MRSLTALRLVACSALALVAVQGASASEILVADAKSQPESMTVAPGGVLLVGSASTPYIYKIAKNTTTATPFVDASSEGAGTFFFGVLADASTRTLWACQLTPTSTDTPAKRRTVLRSFDLGTGAPTKVKWTLPGDNTTCNDMVAGPDKALYVSDTANGKVYRLPAGAATPELFLENMTVLRGIDGLTFLNGQLYVNNVRESTIYRIPIAAGKAGEPVLIALDQPIKGPDGMRAGNGKLFVAENGGGRILSLTVTGDKATVAVLQEGLKTPTGVEPAGDMLWYTERATGKVMSMSMPK